MLFPTFLEISELVFLENQFMLSLLFMLFKRKIPRGGGGGGGRLGVVSGSALRTVTILLTVSTVRSA